jgi:peptidoglycan glycosyltransferase
MNAGVSIGGGLMNISTNIRKLTNIFILFFLALSGALVYWQVAVAKDVTANEHNSRFCLPDNAPVRGNIFDANGVVLAYSQPDPNGRCGYKRIYTDPSLAGLIGYYVPGYQMTGIEAQYDGVLSGRTGSTQLGNTVNSILHRAPLGTDIYLTIDERIQKIADQHYDDPTSTASTQQSKRGSVVITDPHTGAVLAMVSRPNFDPNKMVQTLQQNDLSYYNQLVADPDTPLLERPLQGRYPPGSVYKTLTLLAGLDSGTTRLNDPYDKQHAVGPIEYSGQVIGPGGNNIDLPDANPPYTHHYPVNVEYAFTHSDNIIFAQVGVKAGFDTWMDYNKRFYVGQQMGPSNDLFDLPVAASRVLPEGKDRMEDNELAADSFGQGTDFVTPFQMSLIDNAIANNGPLMRPRLLLRETDHQTVTDLQKSYQGNVIQTFDQRELSTPISQQTAAQTRQAMFGVTFCGSGSLVKDLFSSRASIVGKTGTAQIGGAGTFPHGWMITQAPYSVKSPDQLPALTIVAMKENDGHGAEAVGPMIAHMYEDIFINKKYVPAQLPSPPDFNYCTRTGLLQ